MHIMIIGINQLSQNWGGDYKHPVYHKSSCRKMNCPLWIRRLWKTSSKKPSSPSAWTNCFVCAGIPQSRTQDCSACRTSSPKFTARTSLWTPSAMKWNWTTSSPSYHSCSWSLREMRFQSVLKSLSDTKRGNYECLLSAPTRPHALQSTCTLHVLPGQRHFCLVSLRRRRRHLPSRLLLFHPQLQRSSLCEFAWFGDCLMTQTPL